MAKYNFSCPACKKEFTTESGVILHFRQALTGWDPHWDSRQPHTNWARSNGIKVTDEGYTSDFEKLKDVLHEELSGQVNQRTNNTKMVPGIENLIAHLSCIQVNDNDRSRAATVSGHLVEFVLKARWHQLSDYQRQLLVQSSTNRLWNSYMDIRRNSAMSTKGAAEKAIEVELAYLEQTLIPN
jgi:hypothetical protein